MTMDDKKQDTGLPAETTREFVTLSVADQIFGVEVRDIHDVFQPQSITPVPLSRPEICGVLNLRGRIVTAVDARKRLGLIASDKPERLMAVGVEKGGESYGLIVDAVDEVLRLPDSAFEANPVNLDQRWADVSRGVYRLEGRLLIVLDLNKMLDFIPQASAA